MKKLSLFLALAMILTISGVYAVWTFTQSTDIMDINTTSAIDMTNATSIGTYGTYEFDNQLVMTIDPKEGTTHTTSLIVEGTLTIKFTPNAYAPEDIRNYGVKSFFTHDLTNTAWTYKGTTIMTADSDKHTIAPSNDSAAAMKWTKNDDGTFIYTFSAADIAAHLHLAEIKLESKAEYDAYDTVLGQGQIRFHISDGNTSSGSTPASN